MHYLDAIKTAGEEARRKLHKNAESNIEQVPEATPHKQQLYGHLPLITKTIQIRRTRHAGHCWRSRDELISDVLLCTPTFGRAKARRPARTYIEQLCEDKGCSPKDPPEAITDREKWRERIRDIRAGGTAWWWWSLPSYYPGSLSLSLSLSIYIYIYICVCVCVCVYIYIYIYIYIRESLNKFLDFFRMGILLIVHTWNSSPLRCNLLRLQCTCSTVPTTSGRPHGSPLVWAYQWPSSQPPSPPQLSHNDSLWA